MDTLLRSLALAALLGPALAAQDRDPGADPIPAPADVAAGPRSGPDDPSAGAAPGAPVDDGHAGHEHAGHGHRPDDGVPADSALGRFRHANDYVEGVGWFRFEIARSDVTGTRRRFTFDKYGTMMALLEHRGERGTAETPLTYGDGVVFVAETLDDDGHVSATAVIRVDAEAGNEYLLFDAEGRALDSFEVAAHGGQPARSGPVPGSCIACHTGDVQFQPFMSYPYEPETHALAIDDRWRNVEFAERWLETHHRGSGVFGPYAALFFGQLVADKQAGLIAPHDARYVEILAFRYFEELDLPPPEFLENPFADGDDGGGPPDGEQGDGSGDADGPDADDGHDGHDLNRGGGGHDADGHGGSRR